MAHREQLVADDDQGAPARVRRTAAVIAVLAVGAVLAPMFRSPAEDSYPLSTYPMFARDRGSTAQVETVIGRTAAGDAVRLSTQQISGSDEPVLAAATVSQALATGGGAALCAEVARRLDDGTRTGLDRLEVVSERHDLDRYEPDDPLERRVRHTCSVAS